METTRPDTLFNIRYASRVLERQCRLWRRVDGVVRFSAVLAGSGAIAALGAQNAVMALVAGVVFALFQAIEYAVRPAEVAAHAMAQGKQYAALLARQRRLSDAALADELEAVRVEDDIIVMDSLRQLAYNDVVRERGLDESACFSETMALRAVAFLA
jgi:hypothetical protein